MRRSAIAVIVVGVLVSGAWIGWTAPQQEAPRPGGEKVASPAGGETRLPDGALPPLLGDKRRDDRKYCDRELWAGVVPIIRQLGPGEVIVDEPAWARHTSSAQAGIASWISKCKLAGESIRIRGDDSGDLLGVYSPATGYRATR